MGIIVAISLLAITIVLFLAVNKRWLNDSTLVTLANIAQVVALIAAILVIALPTLNGSANTTPSPGLQLPVLTSQPAIAIALDNTAPILPSPTVANTPTSTSPPITATFAPSPSPTQTSTPNPTPTSDQNLLYQADWSQGMNGWLGLQNWSTLDGMLINDGSGEGGIPALYQKATI